VKFTNTDGRQWELDIETHTVIKEDIGKRQLYSFDGERENAARWYLGNRD
jgi:hypothetical protein